ncbi:unnamed protein product [Clonostachys solani]|uniref:Uncharacterized protein n=1 Tax=Clonostachys solani TaxID=160281 RepID=A0A9P0EPK0_9HYPO|nr:unnamed protein product [Clonostachys solani]
MEYEKPRFVNPAHSCLPSTQKLRDVRLHPVRFTGACLPHLPCTCRVDGPESSSQMAMCSFHCCVNRNRRKQNAVFLLRRENLTCLPSTFENPRYITLHLRAKQTSTCIIRDIIRPITPGLAHENMPFEPTKQSFEDQPATKQTFLPFFENDHPAPKDSEKRVAEPEAQGKPKTAQVFLSNSDEKDQGPAKKPEPEAISEAKHHEPDQQLPQEGKRET